VTERNRAVPVLVVAVLAISWAAPLIRLASAPPLVIAAWRLTIASVILAPFFFAGGARAEWAGRPRKDLLIAAASGVALAVHFATWMLSVRLTTVAASGVLVALSPVFAWVLSVTLLADRPTRRQAAGIVVAIAGAAVIAAADARGGSRSAIVGDLLALVGAVCSAIYYVIGRRLRASLSLIAYIFPVYSLCALLLLITASVSGFSLTGWPATDWLVFALLALGPMLLGHTGFNYALKFLPAYVIGVVALAEPIGATLIAWVLPAIREPPPVTTVVGGVLCLAGVGLTLAGIGARSASPLALSADALDD
jgi:drug/metabolite transporter (DMT)-like permease